MLCKLIWKTAEKNWKFMCVCVESVRQLIVLVIDDWSLTFLPFAHVLFGRSPTQKQWSCCGRMREHGTFKEYNKHELFHSNTNKMLLKKSSSIHCQLLYNNECVHIYGYDGDRAYGQSHCIPPPTYTHYSACFVSGISILFGWYYKGPHRL